MEYGLLTRFRMDKKNSYKSKDQPASAGMLDAVRAELNSKITSVQLTVSALEKNTDAKWAELSAKITAVQLSVGALEHSMDSKLNRMLFLMEEQRNDNKASREQFISFDVRLDRVEQEIKDIKNHFDI